LASAYAFEVIKYVGAAYLIYLGIKTWRTTDPQICTGGRPDAASAWARFKTGIFISLISPKAILFAMAFFPQFLDRRSPIARDLRVLSQIVPNAAFR
jgi:threonine/homoserine/homoserine lactone efflux protein